MAAFSLKNSKRKMRELFTLFLIAADADALNEDNPLECNYFVVCISPAALKDLNNGLSFDEKSLASNKNKAFDTMPRSLFLLSHSFKVIKQTHTHTLACIHSHILKIIFLNGD